MTAKAITQYRWYNANIIKIMYPCLKMNILFFSRFWRKLKGESQLQNFSKQQQKFRKKYPLYKIGPGTYGLPMVHDLNEGSTLNIGAYTSIASGVQIFLGANHRSDWVTSYPFPAFLSEASHIKNYSVSKGSVNIGSDVWICANAIILSGVIVGHGAVIASGAVISKDVPAYSIVAGNPASVVKWRFDEKTRGALLQTSWWEWDEVEIKKALEKL